ncbi:MAG TPA: ATP-binding protein, partial [Thermodesulfovibrionales bacterium]|nr:ATP-binding protein [Thermodesulfovibrionales bacterium]
MIKFSNMRLGEKTETSIRKISHTKLVIFSLVGLGPLFALVLAIIFLQGFTKPVNAILDATRVLKSGNLDHRIEGLKDEFGEVAASFNDMAFSLNEQMHKMQRAEQMTLVGEMAASIAHEVKNPLTGIKIALQMLSENKGLSQTESEIVNASFSQIKRVEALIREVLDFARPKEPEYSLASINGLIEKTVSFIEAVSVQSKNNSDVKVLKTLSTDIPDVLIDPMQMQQAIMNVVLNAYDAMPHGGLLTIKTARYDGSCAMTVTDTGTGIDEKNLQKLFKPFHTTKQKGTGLGLPITKGIVERHGGTITVESKTGQGTTVTITLPLDREGRVAGEKA